MPLTPTHQSKGINSIYPLPAKTQKHSPTGECFIIFYLENEDELSSVASATMSAATPMSGDEAVVSASAGVARGDPSRSGMWRALPDAGNPNVGSRAVIPSVVSGNPYSFRKRRGNDDLVTRRRRPDFNVETHLRECGHADR